MQVLGQFAHGHHFWTRDRGGRSGSWGRDWRNSDGYSKVEPHVREWRDKLVVLLWRCAVVVVVVAVAVVDGVTAASGS